MHPHLFPVDINRGKIVSAVNIEYVALACAFFQLAGIPDRTVRGIVTDPAQLCFIGERNANAARKLAGKRLFFCHFFAKSERPLPIQQKPIRPHKLRTGIIFNITLRVFHD